MNKKWFTLSVLCISSLCLASEHVQVVVMYRLQQLWHSSYKATPDKIEKALWPEITTNITLESNHGDMYPLEFYDSAFGEERRTPFIQSMKVLRYQKETTNYTIIAHSRISNKANTNFVSQLKFGDIVFFHGRVF